MGLGLLLMLLWSRHWRRYFHGQQLLLFMGSYGVLRFLNEYLRDDPQRGGFWIFSTSQWISLALVPGAILGAIYLRKHHPVIELMKKPTRD